MSREDERAKGIKVAWIGVGAGNEREERERRRSGWRDGWREEKEVGRSLLFAAVVVDGAIIDARKPAERLGGEER